MTIKRTIRTTAIALTIAVGSTVLSSCAVDGGYGYGPDVDVGVGYYDTGGYYGGWGRGYRVGPGRGGDHWDNHGHPSNHSYRAAPSGRSAPSIPSRGHAGSSGHGGSHH
jgi:hypothetical protein